MSKKLRKKFSPFLAYSEKVRTFALAFGDDPGADEKEIIERIRIQDEYEKEHRGVRGSVFFRTFRGSRDRNKSIVLYNVEFDPGSG